MSDTNDTNEQLPSPTEAVYISSGGMTGDARFIVEECNRSEQRIVVRNMGTTDLTGFIIYCVDANNFTVKDSTTAVALSLPSGGSASIMPTCFSQNTIEVYVQSVQFKSLIVQRSCY